jgi:hypothetical protein
MDLKSELDALEKRWEPYVKQLWIETTRIGDIVLESLVIPEERRGEGLGRQFMLELLDLASRHNARVTLTPTPGFGPRHRKRLETFYKGLGFKFNKGNKTDFRVSDAMIWTPAYKDTSNKQMENLMRNRLTRDERLILQEALRIKRTLNEKIILGSVRLSKFESAEKDDRRSERGLLVWKRSVSDPFEALEAEIPGFGGPVGRYVLYDRDGVIETDAVSVFYIPQGSKKWKHAERGLKTSAEAKRWAEAHFRNKRWAE